MYDSSDGSGSEKVDSDEWDGIGQNVEETNDHEGENILQIVSVGSEGKNTKQFKNVIFKKLSNSQQTFELSQHLDLRTLFHLCLLA